MAGFITSMTMKPASRKACTPASAEASALFAAKTQSHRQAHLNLRLARTYLAATDPMVSKRTWQVPMEEVAKTKRGATHVRWQCAIKDKAFNDTVTRNAIDQRAEKRAPVAEKFVDRKIIATIYRCCSPEISGVPASSSN